MMMMLVKKYDLEASNSIRAAVDSKMYRLEDGENKRRDGNDL